MKKNKKKSVNKIKHQTTQVSMDKFDSYAKELALEIKRQEYKDIINRELRDTLINNKIDKIKKLTNLILIEIGEIESEQ